MKKLIGGPILVAAMLAHDAISGGYTGLAVRGLLTGLLFVGAFTFVRKYGQAAKGALAVIAGGIAANLLVTTANGGYMPVTGSDRSYGPWIPADGARFTWLGDRVVFGGFSPGDFLMIGGLVFLIVFLIARRIGRRNSSVVTKALTDVGDPTPSDHRIVCA
jgi:hypothetical protein